MIKRYLLYLLRWQLSTPILAICIIYLAFLGGTVATVVANLIGGLIFFWVDRFIFTKDFDKPIWEIKHKAVCKDCGSEGRGYRLVISGEYDRTKATPEYRCEDCSIEKSKQLQKAGVNI